MMKYHGVHGLGLQLPVTEELVAFLNRKAWQLSIRSGCRPTPLPHEVFSLWDNCLHFWFQSF